jgi:hypothetical protein
MTETQERSVPKPVFTDAEAGAREFPDSNARRFNYYTPAKRKQSHYEDVTVEVQPDPRHYLAQGWLYGFSDGRGGYPLDWTALKAWGSDRPEPERFPGSGGKGYDWPAHGWHEFRDPNEEWELTLYRYNANVVRQLNANVDAARGSKAFEQWNRNWVRFVERNVGAWMHVDHGLGLYLYANANRRAPTNMHNNAISVNSMHRIRAAQDLALYNLTLSEEIEDFDGSAHLEAWNSDPAWQGVREVADLRGQRGVRAAGRRAVPQPPGAARRAAQRRLRDPDRGRRRGVRLRRARPALHDPDVRAAHQRPRVRRPQQGNPRPVAGGLGAAGDLRGADAPAAVVAARRQAAALRGRAGRGQEPVHRNPVRHEPGDTEGAGTVTTFKTAESPFKSDNTASNMCGFTLMNNQIGAVVAEVMAAKPNVRVMALPSMIRVDAVGRMDVNYDEVSEALGEEPGFFDAAQFEESMSTHYGRMIHTDEETIMFANPEDAADYIGFDLVPSQRHG